MKNFAIGDIVTKKSSRPFKNGDQTQKIVDFCINKMDPKKRIAAIFDDGTICNVDMLNELPKKPFHISNILVYFTPVLFFLAFCVAFCIYKNPVFTIVEVVLLLLIIFNLKYYFDNHPMDVKTWQFYHEYEYIGEDYYSLIYRNKTTEEIIEI
jgi:hypothetical protein